ncbi:DUF2537 domain-containing protein [Candidatus Kaiserbacteria bacterium]|nr:DUF2537 domain-containing protein [Candidatus Kaiserbacteria bacterium]
MTPLGFPVIRAFVTGLPTSFLSVFKGYRILFHILMAAITCLLVVSGLDWQFYLATRNPSFEWIAIGAAIGFHWLSDVIAGAILGSVIGGGVGTSFRKQFDIVH